MAGLGTIVGAASAAEGDAPEWLRFDAFAYRGQDAAFEPPLPAGHFRNPILSGFQPDPSLCRVGDDFYLVTSSFAWFPGLPIHHSRDLVNWRLIGHAIDRPGMLRYEGLGVSRGLFAPALSFHRGRFYLVCTMVGAGGNFVITASDPKGPWSDPVFLGFDGIDPSIFFDETDGRAWIVHNGPPAGPPRYDGHRAIWLLPFDPVALKITGPRKLLVDGGVNPAEQPVWIEGPHLFRREGWLYLSAAEGGTSVRHSQVIFRSRSLAEPFLPWSGNPILTQRDLDGAAEGAITCTGHAQLVVGPDGQWWASFLACRPAPGSGGEMWLTGRETFLLPVRWTEDGWPVILPRGQRVPLTLPSPRGASVLPSKMSGNFEWRADFSGPALEPDWLRLRGDEPPPWKLEGGALWLPARKVRLDDRGRPAFAARRVQHARFEAELSLPLPTFAGDFAGLALFQSERQHLLLGLRRRADGAGEAVLQVCYGGVLRDVAKLAVAAGAATLKLRCDGLKLHASVAQGGAPGTPVGEPVEARVASVQAAGGGNHFTGAVIGPVAIGA